MDAKLVPATPSVISWAIRDSGYSLRALATKLDLTESEIDGWTKGNHPEITKLKAFAELVQRPFSVFLLPQPPEAAGPSVKFRSATSAKARDLIPEERQRIREAERLQEIVSWLARELQLPKPDVPLASTAVDAEEVGAAIRARLGVTLTAQLSWSSSHEALRVWREAVEALGVIVLMLPMGEESCRGFCIWDDAAPLIAINSAWLPEARTFTLFHELAHLATRTNSACADDGAAATRAAGDRVERWCERVAAAVVVPPEALQAALAEHSSSARHTPDLSTARRVATRFRVSLRAAVLRLIERDEASWALFKSIPPNADRRASGRGGIGRSRADIRRQQYGQRTVALFHDAFGKQVLNAADVVDYLGVSPGALFAGAASASNDDDQ